MEETESNSKKRKAWVCYSKTFDENKSENIDGENENLKMKKVASVSLFLYNNCTVFCNVIC